MQVPDTPGTGETAATTASWQGAMPGHAGCSGGSVGIGSMRCAAIVLVLLEAVACSTPQIGDGGGTDPGRPAGDGAASADAAPADPIEEIPATPDAAVEEDGCYRGPLSRLELLDPTGFASGTAPDDYYGVEAAIDGVPVGLFYLDLFGGIGSLPSGVVPGTYTIAGDDTVWSICAVCVWATFGVSEEIWVMAQSGTVRIDQVGTRVTGSLSNIELVEIDVDDQPIPDGCSATVDGITFDVPVQ